MLECKNVDNDPSFNKIFVRDVLDKTVITPIPLWHKFKKVLW